jgi:hypothetical protein
VVALDGGNFLAEPGPAGDVKSRLLLETFAEAGYDAVSIGPREAGRWPEARALSGDLEIPWVSANARLPRAADIPPYRILESTGLRIALVGLGSEGRGAGEFDSAPEALGLALEELAGQVDRVIAFGHIPVLRMMKMAAQFPDLTAILSGYGQFVTDDEPLKVGDVVMASPGNRGRQIVDLRLSLAGAAPRVVSYRLVVLDRTLDGAPTWEKRLADALQEVREVERNRALAAAPEETPSPYALGVTCARCHSEEASVWSGTAHARAFATLVRDGVEFDPQCVSCHVTGWERPGGFTDAIRTPELKDVQCEACHGPGGEHAESPQAPYGVIASPRRLCTVCHIPEKTDHFDYQLFWQKIAH